MNRYRYAFFNREKKCKKDEAHDVAIAWANKKGNDGWHLFEMKWRWSWFKKALIIHAKGCRKFSVSE